MLPDHDRVKNDYYISATSSVLDPTRHVIKDGDLFGVFNRFGDILPIGRHEQGLYFGGTKLLSLHELRINSLRPLFLSSSVDDDDILMCVDLTNPDLYSKGQLILQKDSIHILRTKLLFEPCCHEKIRMRNFGRIPVTFTLDVLVDADFRDIFEVRGIKRKKDGKRFPARYGEKDITFYYEGLDDVARSTFIEFSEVPQILGGTTCSYIITLEPGCTRELFFTVSCRSDNSKGEIFSFDESLTRLRTRIQTINEESVSIFTSNEQFNESLKRSLSDIRMMTTKTGDGYYPYGGIPWFCTPFGRDGIITAFETLWLCPNISKGVLGYLASKQAEEVDSAKAAEPGKIMHEARTGELAATGEIPFGLYYGSVDSTPLFIMLAGAYWKRTGDKPFIQKIWGNIEKALLWMEQYGDVDGDGYLEYIPDEKGLQNQGWKDSDDSVFHSDGSFAQGPIALCEVQGYQYAAKKGASILCHIMGHEDLAGRLEREAETLKNSFNRDFWDDEINSYVLALDGEKRPCRVRASNAGHALFTGISDPDKALKLAETLMSDDLFSGWGIRTAGTQETLYNPMSYHNGSIWPHDNALIAAGLAAYGFKNHFIKVFSSIFDASIFMDSQRLPELFCGFHKRKGVPPTLYPVACSPQTWAAGALIFMLQACLCMDFEHEQNKITLKKPVLPEFLEQVRLENLAISGDKKVDLFLRRHGKDVTVEVLKKPDDVSIVVIK
jgi:glycogen debranching enzyme